MSDYGWAKGETTYYGIESGKTGFRLVADQK